MQLHRGSGAHSGESTGTTYEGSSPVKRSGILAAAAALTLVLGVVSPSSATHGGNHPTFRSRNVWFHCTGETKLQQVNWLTSAGSGASDATWNESPPAGSVVDGAGCGSFEPGWVSNELYDAVFVGSFYGNLRDMTVRIHQFIMGQTRQGDTQRLRVYAEIDGEPIFPGGTPDTGYTGRTLTVTPEEDNSGATHLFEFSITNIGYANDVFDAEGRLIDVETGGIATEDGNGTQEHSLKLLIGADSFLGEDPPTGWDFWVWDTSEVPSGITFNPSSLATAKVAADLPDGSI